LIDTRRLDASYCVSKDVRIRGYLSKSKGAG
jgi:hypothetical protein